VIQDFHASNDRSLIASTREQALALKQKYAWWYNSEQQSYRKFKNKLIAMLPGVEIMEGKEGFGYE